jgi:hypothetical protein
VCSPGVTLYLDAGFTLEVCAPASWPTGSASTPWTLRSIDEAPGNTRLRKRVTLGAASGTGLAHGGADRNDH